MQKPEKQNWNLKPRLTLPSCTTLFNVVFCPNQRTFNYPFPSSNETQTKTQPLTRDKKKKCVCLSLFSTHTNTRPTVINYCNLASSSPSIFIVSLSLITNPNSQPLASLIQPIVTRFGFFLLFFFFKGDNYLVFHFFLHACCCLLLLKTLFLHLQT